MPDHTWHGYAQEDNNRRKLCNSPRQSDPTIDPHSSDLLLTGIIEIDKNSGKEKEKYDEFIKQRTEIAQKTNFVPEICSFGSANPEQKAQLEELVKKYRLSFNMDSDDLGRLFGFRYTLPMFDEKH
jgi:hypothetical protein